MELVFEIILGLFIYWCIPTIWEKIDDLIYDIKLKINKRKDKKERTVKRHYNEYKKKKRKQEKWNKKHPILSMFIEFYDLLIRILWYRVPDYPTDVKLWIKTKYQRMVRGWANEDACDLNDHLSTIIKEACEWLKKNKTGLPSNCILKIVKTEIIKKYTDEKNFIIAERKWDDILFDIIWTFKIAKKINNSKWFYPRYKEYFTQKELKSYTKLCKDFSKDYPKDDYHVMTLEECEQYRKGWKLFQENFFNLYD